MAHAAGNVSIYRSIYLSRGSVCPFQCSQEVGNALFSTCAHYNWRLVSIKIPGILAMMQMTQGRQQQRSETPEKQQLYTTRPLPESDDERQSHPINVNAGTTGATKGISKGLPETPAESSSCNRANSNLGTSNELVCVSSRACSE